MSKKKTNPKAKSNGVKMTVKQKRFCDEYLITLNGTEAAIKAGYSKNSATQIANENLTKPYIRDYIQKRLDEYEEQSVMKQQEVMQRLTSVGRREETETVVMMAKKRRSYYDESGKKVIEETEEPVLVPIPAKLSDTNKALELMGKRYALFTDKVDVDASLAVVQIVDDLDEGDYDGS